MADDEQMARRADRQGTGTWYTLQHDDAGALARSAPIAADVPDLTDHEAAARMSG
jgi:hypothetical protein